MTNTSWNGTVGNYLDPAQWTPGDVPLYGSDVSATISAGTATLIDAEPNGVTLTLGRPPGGGAGASPVLGLSNSALGSSMTLDVRGFAVLGVDGFDTAYGTINVSPADDGQGPGNGNALVVNIGAGSQINQEGTVSVINSSLITGGLGTLNNDGQIFIGPGGVGVFGGTFPQGVTGSGTITLAGGTVDGASVGLFDAAATQTVDLLGGTLSTAVSLQAAIKDWNDNGALMFPSVAVAAVQFNQTSDAGGDSQLFGASGQLGGLHLLGSYATVDFAVTQGDGGSSIGVSGHPLPAA